MGARSCKYTNRMIFAENVQVLFEPERTFTMNIRNALYEIIPDKNRILMDGGIEDKYLSDSLGRLKGWAAAVIFPKSTEEIAKLLKYANDNHIPVTPRGAGTNLVGSTVPVSGGIVLDLSQMNRILEIDRETMTATVEPGVTLGDFQSYAEKLGLFYPPDPGEKKASIGGNISTNAGGMRAVKYGVTRDYVRGLEVVLANGEVLELGSKNVKDSTGLSLKNLVIGSEGTLAVITKCTLKLIPKPENSISVLISYPDLNTGINSVIQILHRNISPTAVEFIERSVIALGEAYTGLKFPLSDADAYLLLIFDGKTAEIEANIAALRQLALDTKALNFRQLDTIIASEVWEMRGSLVKAVEAVSEQEPVDIVVPINKTAEFISFVHHYEKKCGMQMIAFGHAGDGNVHLCVVRGDRTQEQWNLQKQITLQSIYEKAYELGGLTSGEHGIGISKQEHYQSLTPAANLNAMNLIKDALDQRHILNPYKVYMGRKTEKDGTSAEYNMCGGG